MESTKRNEDISLAESCSDSDVINHNEKQKSAKPKPPFMGFGMLCCILTSVLFAVNALMVKMVKSIGPIEVLGARCWVQFFMLLPFITYNWMHNKVDFLGPRNTFKLLCLRSLTGSTAAMFLYQSLQRLPLGDAVTISFLSLVFTMLFAAVFLNERPTVLDIIFSIVIIAGVVLVAQPPFLFDSSVTYDTERLYGTIFGILCSAMAGVTFVIVRKLGIATHATLNVFYYSFAGSITSLIFTTTIETFKFPCSSEIQYIIFAGIAGCGAQIFMALALQYERAGTFSMLKSFQIILSFAFQVIILQDIPSSLSLGGAALVFASIFGIAVRKIYNEYFKGPKLGCKK